MSAPTLLDLDDPTIEPHDAAKTILVGLKVPVAAVRLLTPVLADWLRCARRADVAKIERASWRRPFPGAADILTRIHAEQSLGDLLPLLAQTFRVDRLGAVVTWGDATAAQHRERAEAQRRRAAACVVDAERHDQAANLIDEAGVSSLSELIAKRVAA